MLELFVSFYLIIQSFYYYNNIPKKALTGSFTVCGKRHRSCLWRGKMNLPRWRCKSGPMQPISLSKWSSVQSRPLLTFMALKSFFIFSGIPVMKESSGSSRISLFSNLEERTEGKQGSQRTFCSSDWYKTLAGSNWSHRGVTGTLRNTRPQRRGQETQPVFYPFLAWVTIGCCTR